MPTLQEVPEDQVNADSAYILFYERQGLNRSQYMPDVTGKEPQSTDDDGEFDTDFKKYCVIQ